MVLIIGAVLVAFILFVMIFFGASKQASTAMLTADQISWEAATDEELLSYLPNQKISAVKRYLELTDVGLKEAKDAVEWIMAHPDLLEKGKSAVFSNTGGAGVRDLIADGKLDEAVKVYADFMGVDKFTAREAVEAMIAEYRLVDHTDDESYSEDDDPIFRKSDNE